LQEEEGWARGRLKGREGVFPTNFGAVIESTPSPVQIPAPSGASEPSAPQDEVPKHQEENQIPPKKAKLLHFSGFPRGIESIEFQNWLSRPLKKY